MRTSPAPTAALTALLALTLLTSGCITTDDGGKITIDLGGLTNATDRLGDAPGEVGKRVDPGGLVKNIGRSNATKVEFPLGSDFETGYFEGSTLVIRLNKVENMDRVAAIDPDGNKLDEIPVEPAQRRIEILLPSPPTPGTYELVKLTETSDGEKEVGSVEFTLKPRPALTTATIHDNHLVLNLTNRGNSPGRVTRITLLSNNATITSQNSLDLLPPGRTTTITGPAALFNSDELTAEVHTQHSGVLTQPVAQPDE